MRRKIPTWVWIAVVAGLLTLCVVVACVAGYFQRRQDAALEESYVGPVAIVAQYDQIVDVVDLGTVTENFTRTYEGESGQKNTVEFAPGQARMLEASCPDHRCVAFGWQYGGEFFPIACLPNSVIVRVVDLSPEPSQEPGVDGATK